MSSNDKIEVNELIGLLVDLMGAVAAHSEIYGTHYEEKQLRDFLLNTGRFFDKYAEARRG